MPTLVGTSGWSYRHWSGAFYPQDLTSGQWLEYYMQQFPTVEINGSFYRLPTVRMIDRWRKLAPPGFAFAAKGSRLITHFKRLASCEDAATAFMDRLQLLRRSAGGRALAVAARHGAQLAEPREAR